MARPLRVLIADKHEDMRAIVRATLEMDGGFEVVGEGRDGYEAVAAATLLQPDVVVLDWEMPGMTGIEALPAIVTESPAAKVIMYSSRLEATAELDALARGASAFVERTQSPAELVRVIQRLFDSGP